MHIIFGDLVKPEVQNGMSGTLPPRAYAFHDCKLLPSSSGAALGTRSWQKKKQISMTGKVKPNLMGTVSPVAWRRPCLKLSSTSNFTKPNLVGTVKDTRLNHVSKVFSNLKSNLICSYWRRSTSHAYVMPRVSVYLCCWLKGSSNWKPCTS